MKVETKKYIGVSKFGTFTVEIFYMKGIRTRERVKITKKVKKVELPNSIAN